MRFADDGGPRLKGRSPSFRGLYFRISRPCTGKVAGDNRVFIHSGALMAASKDSIPRVLRYLFLGLSYFLVCFHRNSLAVMGPRISSDFGLTTSSLGVVGSLFMYPYALMQVPSGFLADRIHPIAVLRVSVTLITLGTVLFATCSSYTVLCLSRLILGFGAGLFYVPAAKLMSSENETSSIGAALGLFISVGNMGTIFASAPLTLLVMRWSWRAIVLITGLISAALLLVSFGTPWTRFHGVDRGVGEGGRGRYVLGPEDTVRPRHAFEQLPPSHSFCRFPIDETRNEFQDSRLRRGWRFHISGALAPEVHDMISICRQFGREIAILGLWSFFLVGAEVSFRGVFAVDYLMKARGFAMDKAGLMLLAMTVGSSVGTPLVGWISDRFRPRKRVVLIFSLACVLWWSVQPLGSPDSRLLIQMTSYFVMGVMCGCFIVAFAWARETLSEHLVGLTIGIFNLAGFLGSATLSHILGKVAEGRWGYTGVFLINASALFLFTLPVVLVREGRILHKVDRPTCCRSV